MRAVDERALEQGLDSFALMRAAGQAVANAIQRISDKPCRVVVLAGPGNNGGDGAIAAFELNQLGYDVQVICFGKRCGNDSDAERAFHQWDNAILDVSLESPTLDDAVFQMIEAADIIVDALFGAGLSRALEGVHAVCVETVNRSNARVVSVDVPSGLDGNSHCCVGPCIQADITVTFFRYKPAHFLFPGRSLCGEIVLAQIGLTAAQLAPSEPYCWLNQPHLFHDALPSLKVTAHKFHRGHVLVRSGLPGSTGAARLSASTALRSGAGLVTLATCAQALPINAAHLTAVMLTQCDTLQQWKDTLGDSRITVVVIGPGNGVDTYTRQCVEAALFAGKHCVIDADALSCWNDPVARDALCGALNRSPHTAILTPHAGEFVRAFGQLAESEFPSKLHQAKEAARRSGAVVVYKGADTVVASPDGRASVNASAPPWLATAGAGDVLAGLIASLVAQGMAAFEAACAAVWLHSAAAASSGYPLCAEDLVNQVGRELGRISPINLREL